MKKQQKKEIRGLGFSPCEQVGDYDPDMFFLPLETINILPQVRTLINGEDLEDLACNISHTGGLLEPIIVGDFGVKPCQEYLAMTNDVCLSGQRLRDLKSVERKGKKRFFIVLSGERRLRAHLSLLKTAEEENRDCSLCSKREAITRKECFVKNLREKKEIKCFVIKDPPKFMAMGIQLGGNLYRSPTEQEISVNHFQQYRYQLAMDSTLTIAKFAKLIGRSTNQIRAHLKVFELPPEILKHYLNKTIPFGVAEELVLLHLSGETTRNLEWWENRFLVDGVKIPEFKKRVKKYLKHKASEAFHNLELLMEDFSREAAKKTYVKRVVEGKMIDFLHHLKVYWDRVYNLYEEGQLGLDSSPLSDKSPRNFLSEVIVQLKEKTMGHLGKVMLKQKKIEAMMILTELERALEAADQEREEKKKSK